MTLLADCNSSDSMTGRASAMAELAAVLETTPCVTLSGATGVGKTFFVGEFAKWIANRYGFETRIVNLKGVTDSRIILAIISDALGRHDLVDDEMRADRHATREDVLVLLDGCVVASEEMVPLVQRICRACNGYRFVFVSRSPAGMSDEVVFELAPLETPGSRCTTLDEFLAFDSARLLLSRIRAVDPTFSLKSCDLHELGEICRLTAGVPLVIEIAVLLSRLVGIGEVVSGLERVVKTSRGVSGHDIGSAVSWMLDTLSPRDRRCLELISVFRDPVDIDSLIRVAQDSGNLISRLELIEGLAQLSENHMVKSSVVDGVGRYRVGAALGSQIRNLMRREGRWRRYAESHLTWLGELARGVTDSLVSGSRQTSTISLVDRHETDLRSGLNFALSARDPKAIDLGGELWRFWELRGKLSEGRCWLESILELDLGGETSSSNILDGLGMLAWRQQDCSGARAFLELAKDVASARGDRRDVARITNHLGLVALFSGDTVAADQLFQASHDELDQLDAQDEAQLALSNIALIAIEEGKYEDAIDILDRTLFVQVALGDRHGQGTSYLHRAIACYFTSDLARSAVDALASWRIFLELGDDRNCAMAVATLAAACARSFPTLACELYGLAEQINFRAGLTWPSGWQERIDQAVAPARDALGQSVLRVVDSGARSSPEMLVARVESALGVSAVRAVIEPTVSVRTLGHFEVRRAGRPVHLEPLVARLVKLLVARSQPLHIEQVIEVLWPDTDLARGRRRLRNLLSKLHRTTGPLVVRSGETLMFVPTVSVDVVTFERVVGEAISALTTGGDVEYAHELARAALEEYRGDFLVGEIYEEWTVLPRERLRSLRLRLIESWSQFELRRGNMLEAESLLRTALEADPTNDRYYVALAQLLVRTNRSSAAQDLLRRVSTTAGESVFSLDDVEDLEELIHTAK